MVKLVALAMCLCATSDGGSKVAVGECISHHSHVVVEVAADDNGGIGILLGDVPGDIHHSLCPILQLLLLSRFQVAVEHLDSMCSDLQLSPAEICPNGLHHGQLCVGQRGCPCSTIPLSRCLERPIVVEVESTLQFCLIETHEVGFVEAENLIHLLLLGLSVEASHIVAQHGELIALLQDF